MNQNLKTVVIVIVALVVFKVLDKMFLDKSLSQVFNWEENFETKHVGGWKVTKANNENYRRAVSEKAYAAKYRQAA